MHTSQPIGVFDSGIGGLAIVRAIKEVLPNERIWYIGDTAHLPYGEKSTVQLQAYATQISTFLYQQNCKLILIACNAASAAATALLQQRIPLPIGNVIAPVIAYIQTHYPAQPIGLIGTPYLVQAGLYTQALRTLGQVQAVAAPLLAPMIEEGWGKACIDIPLLQTYLLHPQLRGIQALLLGCTHYLLIAEYIAQAFPAGVEIIDVASLVAAWLNDFLHDHHLAHRGTPTDPDCYMASCLTPSFQAAIQRMVGATAVSMPFDFTQ